MSLLCLCVLLVVSQPSVFKVIFLSFLLVFSLLLMSKMSNQGGWGGSEEGGSILSFQYVAGFLFLWQSFFYKEAKGWNCCSVLFFFILLLLLLLLL